MFNDDFDDHYCHITSKCLCKYIFIQFQFETTSLTKKMESVINIFVFVSFLPFKYFFF